MVIITTIGNLPDDFFLYAQNKTELCGWTEDGTGYTVVSEIPGDMKQRCIDSNISYMSLADIQLKLADNWPTLLGNTHRSASRGKELILHTYFLYHHTDGRVFRMHCSNSDESRSQVLGARELAKRDPAYSKTVIFTNEDGVGHTSVVCNATEMIDIADQMEKFGDKLYDRLLYYIGVTPTLQYEKLYNLNISYDDLR